MADEYVFVAFEGIYKVVVYSSDFEVAKGHIIEEFELEQRGCTPSNIAVFIPIDDKSAAGNMAELSAKSWPLLDKAACRFAYIKPQAEPARLLEQQIKSMSRRTASLGNLGAFSSVPSRPIDIDAWRRGQAGHPNIQSSGLSSVLPSPPLSDAASSEIFEEETTPGPAQNTPRPPLPLPKPSSPVDYAAMTQPASTQPSASAHKPPSPTSSLNSSSDHQMSELADSLSSLSSSDLVYSGPLAQQAIKAILQSGRARDASAFDPPAGSKSPLSSGGSSPTEVVAPTPLRRTSSQEFLNKYNHSGPASEIPPLPVAPVLPPGGSQITLDPQQVAFLRQAQRTPSQPVPASAPPSPSRSSNAGGPLRSIVSVGHLRRSSLPVVAPPPLQPGTLSGRGGAKIADPRRADATQQASPVPFVPASPSSELRKLKSTSALRLNTRPGRAAPAMLPPPRVPALPTNVSAARYRNVPNRASFSPPPLPTSTAFSPHLQHRLLPSHLRRPDSPVPPPLAPTTVSVGRTTSMVVCSTTPPLRSPSSDRSTAAIGRVRTRSMQSNSTLSSNIGRYHDTSIDQAPGLPLGYITPRVAPPIATKTHAPPNGTKATIHQ